MAQEKEKKKKSTGKKSLITLILTPLIIVVLVAGMFFAIVDAIVGIIQNTLVSIFEFIRNPLGTISRGIGGLNNALSKFFRRKRAVLIQKTIMTKHIAPKL